MPWKHDVATAPGDESQTGSRRGKPGMRYITRQGKRNLNQLHSYRKKRVGSSSHTFHSLLNLRHPVTGRHKYRDLVLQAGGWTQG
jgi:hypothetical protein